MKYTSKYFYDNFILGCGDGKYLNVNTSIFNIGAEKSTRLSEVSHDKDNEVSKN